MNYRGCKEIEYIYHGEWNDPELVYDGKGVNYWVIEDEMWQRFLEESGHVDCDSGRPEVEEEFNTYVQEHEYDCQELIINSPCY